METIQLNRLNTSDYGTFGELLRDGTRIAVTCELPWADNRPLVSCIPQGVYHVTRFSSPSKGADFLVNGVPDRSMIEIHVANLPSELLGCIGVGDITGAINGKPAVLNSRATLGRLLDTLPDEFMLDVGGVV